MSVKTKFALLSAALALGPFSMAAQAAQVIDFVNIGQGIAGENVFVDDNREYLLDHVATVPGQIDVGDSLRGLAVWTKINGNLVGLGTVHSELTSVFQVRVAAKNQVSPGLFTFTFEPDPLFPEAQALGVAGQAMAIFYDDNTPNGALDYDDPASVFPANTSDDGTGGAPAPSPNDVSVGPYVHEETFVSSGTDGDYFWSVGFTGPIVNGVATPAPGEGWATSQAGPDNVGIFFAFDSGNDLASVNFSLNRVYSGVDTGIGDLLVLELKPSFFNPGAGVEFNGSATIEGVRNLRTPFETSSQSTLTFRAIPEPASAVLMGIGLMLLGKTRRRHA